MGTLLRSAPFIALSCLAWGIESPSNAQTFPGGWSVEIVLDNIDRPTALAFTPDGKWMLVAAKASGDIVAHSLETGIPQTTPFVSLPLSGSDISEGGMLGLAVDPEFDSTKFVYSFRTATAETFQIDRHRAAFVNGELVATHTETIFGPFPAGQAHNGGAMKFGPDGYLYVALGDHGNSAAAQDPFAPSGKILRLTRDGHAAPGNPWAGGAGMLPYTWAKGFRNCFGLAFDPADGSLWMSEPGPSLPNFDEINRVVAGGNYGWGLGGLADGTGPQWQSWLVDPALAFNLGTSMPTPVGLAFVHSWRYPSDLVGDGLVWCTGTMRAHRLRRGGAHLDTIAFQEKLQIAAGSSVILELGPDGYLYLCGFYSPTGFVARIAYEESQLPPVSVAVRGEASLGGGFRFYVTSKPPAVDVGMPDLAFALFGQRKPIGEWTPFGELMLETYEGVFGEFDRYGVAAFDIEIPNHSYLQGYEFEVQAFRLDAASYYSTGVTHPEPTHVKIF